MSWTTANQTECSPLAPGDSSAPSGSAKGLALSGLTGVPPARGSRQPLAAPSAGGHPRAEWRLTGRVFARCHRFILEACKFSSICPEFLGALTANESGGHPNAVRFEPAVYRHLKSVAGRQSQSYGGIRPHDLAAEVDEILQPKAQMFHARYLDSPFAERHGQALSPLEDEALREEQGERRGQREEGQVPCAAVRDGANHGERQGEHAHARDDDILDDHGRNTSTARSPPSLKVRRTRLCNPIG